MPQQEIEVILARHLSEYLFMPIFIVNPDGDLVFYNEPAEAILGKNYSETGIMPASEWSTVFQPMTADGKTIPPEELPLVIALRERRPAHKVIWIHGLDGIMREIEITAFPLIGQGSHFGSGLTTTMAVVPATTTGRLTSRRTASRTFSPHTGFFLLYVKPATLPP
jgi:PAS domain-containing protein